MSRLAVHNLPTREISTENTIAVIFGISATILAVLGLAIAWRRRSAAAHDGHEVEGTGK